MAATIEGAFVLIDKASSTMAKMERQAIKTMAAIEGVGAAQDAQTKRGATASRAMESNTGALKDTEKGSRSAAKEVENLGRQHEQSAKRVSVLERALKSLRGELTRLQGARGGSSAGMSGIKGLERDLKTAKGALSSFIGSFGVLFHALMAFKFPAIGVGIGVLVQSLTALGGAALGVLPTISALASGFLGIPAAAAAAVQGLSVVKLAFAGVMQAATAGMQAQNQWALNQREFQQQVTSAMDAVISAHQGLTEAIYNQQQAQIQLTVARRDATRTLQDMEFAAQTSVLKEARAGLDIQQAKMELQQAMMTPGTTQLQLQSLRLGVLEATSSARQTRTEAQRARQDATRGRRGDPTSAPVMEVAQARHAQTQANLEVSNSVRALTRAEAALNLTTSQGNAGVSAYKRQLMGLQPIQRQFVRFLVGKMGPGDKNSLMGQFQKMQESAGEGLFPQLEKGVRTLSGGFGILDSAARKTGSIMGGMADKVINAFFGKKGIAQTTQILHTNQTVLGHVSGAVGYFADMLRRLMVAAGPTLIWLSKMVENWFKLHDATMATSAGQDALRTKFEHFRVVLKEMLTLLHNLHMWFHNISLAAWDFNQAMTKGAIKGTAGWAKSLAPGTEGAKKLHDWFMGLIPLLQSLGKLFIALGKGLAGLTSPGANQGTAGLVNDLSKMVPTLERIIRGLEKAFGPPILAALQSLGGVAATLVGNGGPFAMFLKILTKIIQGFDWLLKLPGVGKGLTIFIASVFAVSTVAGYLGKMTSVISKVTLLRDRWRQVSGAQDAGMASPGTGKRGLLSRFFGGGGQGPGSGGLSAGMQASVAWGIKSGDGPGSLVNPLMVRIEGGMSGPGNSIPGTATRDLGGEVTGVEAGAGVAALSRMEKIGAWLAGKGKAGSAIATGLGKLPGLGGLARGATATSSVAKGITAVGEVAAPVTETAGVLSKIGSVAGVLGKVAVPLAVITTAIPAISAFISTKGNVLQKFGAAGAAAFNSLTFGLFAGGPSRQHQVTQGQQRAATSFKGFQTDAATGLLTSHGLAQYRGRINELKGQLSDAQTGHMVAGPHGIQTRVGVDTAVAQDRAAGITGLNALAGGNVAKSFTDAFGTALQSGQKPKQAMQLMLQGLTQQMAGLTPAGRDVMLKAMETWGTQIEISNPKLKGPVNDLTTWITQSFQGMGQNVNNVNATLVQQSSAQWQQIEKGITQPGAAALSQLTGTFGKIQQVALGALEAMGYNKTQAASLFGNVVAKAQGAKNINVTGQGAQHGGTFAAGGRIPGANPRDVYAYGNNVFGGGELVMNRHHELEANARLMRHGEPTVGSIVSSRTTPNWAFASGGRATSGGSVVLDPGVNMTVGQEPQILRDLRGLSAELHQAVYVISGYRSPAHSLAVGGFANDPHTRGQAADIGVGSPSLASMFGVTEAQLRAVGLYRPFYPASAHEVNHVQLLAGGSAGPIIPGLSTSAAGGGAGKQLKALHGPRIQGVGGIPYVLAQTASDTMAAGMTKYLRQKIAKSGGGGAMNFAGVAGLGGNAQQNEALGRRMMLAGGWSAAQWPALQALWTQESGWNANAVNPSSGAYGIPQSLGHGHPYNLGDARGQIAWGLNYIKGRYGSPDAAEAHERAYNWYSGGGRTANWAGWHKDGGIFTTNGPTVFGAGEGGVKETVKIGPAESNSTRPIHIEIHHMEVNRKGDVKKIVDEELELLAASLRGD